MEGRAIMDGGITIALLMLSLFILPRFPCEGFAPEKWDFLVFTQAWPMTVCIKNKRNGEKCIFPENRLQWTIHGVWPNRIHGDDPSFCNKSIPFDETKIEQIKAGLKRFWPNLLYGQTEDSLWKHEWEKHGTCAVDLEALNNEKKYFEKGLNLYGSYNMTSLLPVIKIFPEKVKQYSVIHIWNVIRNYLNKMPHIECIEKENTGYHYLSEIRLCFDKNFKLIDCTEKHFHDGPLTNCPRDRTIIFPKDVDIDATS